MQLRGDKSVVDPLFQLSNFFASQIPASNSMVLRLVLHKPKGKSQLAMAPSPWHHQIQKDDEISLLRMHRTLTEQLRTSPLQSNSVAYIVLIVNQVAYFFTNLKIIWCIFNHLSRLRDTNYRLHTTRTTGHYNNDIR